MNYVKKGTVRLRKKLKKFTTIKNANDRLEPPSIKVEKKQGAL